MPVLRLTQSRIGGDRYRVEFAVEAEGRRRQTAVSEFSFDLSEQEQEDLRWYLEDYLTCPLGPGAGDRRAHRERHGTHRRGSFHGRLRFR
jgi:hypothetical protein